MYLVAINSICFCDYELPYGRSRLFLRSCAFAIFVMLVSCMCVSMYVSVLLRANGKFKLYTSTSYRKIANISVPFVFTYRILRDNYVLFFSDIKYSNNIP